jgi:hypothetical protein
MEDPEHTSSGEKDKENATEFDPLIDKDSILMMTRRKILEESNNHRAPQLHNVVIPSSEEHHKKKLKNKESTTSSESCNAVFHRWLPPKKKDPLCFNSVGNLSIGKVACDLGPSINFVSSSILKNNVGV